MNIDTQKWTHDDVCLVSALLEKFIGLATSNDEVVVADYALELQNVLRKTMHQLRLSKLSCDRSLPMAMANAFVARMKEANFLNNDQHLQLLLVALGSEASNMFDQGWVKVSESLASACKQLLEVEFDIINPVEILEEVVFYED